MLNMLPSLSADDSSDLRMSHPKLTGNFYRSASVLLVIAYIRHMGLCQFYIWIVNSFHAGISYMAPENINGMTHIAALINKLKIIKTRIRWLTIDMIDHGFTRDLIQKTSSNQSMDHVLLDYPVLAKTDHWITTARKLMFSQTNARALTGFDSSDSAECADHVDILVTRNVLPEFI